MILYYIFQFLQTVLTIYSFAIIIYIFMSWVPSARETAIGRFLTNICEPYLEPFRKIIPPIGMIDISPIVALLVIRFASLYGLTGLYNMIARFM
ncbi:MULTISPECIES: YggT family protein [Bacillus]|uniref:YggT family protein n=1 Tax=Bacillus TaxID=1386 RepID=UPI000D229DD5|nr:YggT family protein [Bacillus pumilus]AVI40832.1 YggT family protein [Bacillus pumilus]MBU8638399.1 YggT family protein [Bacillus pumilus]MBU8725968.1 YggT family protein [Bacillus pumilus]QHQ76287.1 YggT family protein [Bacillus pumilus]